MTYAANVVITAPIVVTATRMAQTVDQTLASVTIITRDEIERSSAHSLPELIAGSVGIDIKTSGGYGKSSSVFIRGTESRHVLLLIDGIRFHDTVEAYASANFQYLPLDIIERIEIVRGPKASLYGSDAMGGVIQVFTTPDKSSQYASVGVGTENSKRLNTGLSGSHSGINYSLRASQFQTDGISAKADNTEKDGYRNSSFSAKIDISFNEDSKLGASIYHAEGETEYDDCGGSNNCQTDFTQWAADTYWKQEINDYWWTEIHISKSDHKRLSKKDASGDYMAETKMLSWLNNVEWSDQHTIIGGIDFVRDEVFQSYLSDVDWYRESSALFGNMLGSLERGGQYSLGLRYEDNQQFGSHIVGDAAYEWLLFDDSTLRVSYGEAFKAPSLHNLYGQPGWYRTLKPEESKTIELSLTIDRLTVSVFNTKIDNLILYKNWTDGYENIGEVEIDGLELEVYAKLASWDIHPSITLINPMDRSNNRQLQSRSQRTFKINGQRTFGKIKLSLDWIAQSHRYSYGFVRTAGYGKVDVGLVYKLGKDLALNVKAGNLFDKQYQLNNGYNTEGRNTFISLNYRN